MEHRWGARHSIDISVRLDGRPRWLMFARLKNASLSGAYIETRAALTTLTRVVLEIDRAPGLRDDSNRLAAYVVRTDANGCGLEWCDFAPRAIVTLIAQARRDMPRPADVPRLPSAATRPIPADGPLLQYTPIRATSAAARP